MRTSILRHAEVFVATRISFFPSARRWGGETWGAEPSLKFASALCLRRKKDSFTQTSNRAFYTLYSCLFAIIIRRALRFPYTVKTARCWNGKVSDACLRRTPGTPKLVFCVYCAISGRRFPCFCSASFFLRERRVARRTAKKKKETDADQSSEHWYRVAVTRGGHLMTKPSVRRALSSAYAYS